MAIPTQYNFTKQINNTSDLENTISISPIIISIDHIDTTIVDGSMQINVWFKDALSDTDSSLLSSIVSSYIDPLPTIPSNVVTTQYELNDKDIKLSKIKATVVSGSPNKAEFSLKIPGTFGNDNDGRYIAGGDGWIDTFDSDDYLLAGIFDNDRLIAAAYGNLTDDQMIAQGDYPNYPLIKSFNDTEVSDDNQGWYFWPLAQGYALAPMGEIEFEPIAGYGHLPAGLYITITVIRPNVASGNIRCNLFWGKKE